MVNYMRYLIVGMVALLAGCAGGAGPAQQSATPKAPDEYVYAGALPCKQCASIDTTVTLKGVGQEDAKAHTFTMQAVYRQHPRQQPPDTYTGTWEILHGMPADPDATVLSLMDDTTGNQAVTYYFQQIDPHTIELIDPHLKRFENGDSLRLTRW